ncbi:RDD family protein [Dyadobacter sp. NIV53]|uniref:RDD family protein n=1 Tax=Dyadobacter sp. NIV53 TaxID=2861765 RepID=UPI001C86FB87|nr:RDD family protein [Dyadobacter sp. NIV53]
MSLQIETAQNVGVDYEIASVGERILAQFVDYAVYFVWIMAVVAITSVSDSAKSGISSPWITTGAMMLPIMLYPLLCEYFMDGQTVGKMALKIKVIRLDGSKATLSSYLLRWLLSIVDVSLFSGLVAIFAIVINGKGQRLGDIAAGTAVIKTHPTIRLEHIMTPDLDPNYRPAYPGVVRLSDKDIRTIRKVLATNNEELMETTMHKMEDLLGINSLETASVFLWTIINDYNFYASSEV